MYGSFIYCLFNNVRSFIIHSFVAVHLLFIHHRLFIIVCSLLLFVIHCLFIVVCLFILWSFRVYSLFVCLLFIVHSSFLHSSFVHLSFVHLLFVNLSSFIYHCSFIVLHSSFVRFLFKFINVHSFVHGLFVCLFIGVCLFVHWCLFVHRLVDDQFCIVPTCKFSPKISLCPCHPPLSLSHPPL